jgi:hypothetical protein
VSFVLEKVVVVVAAVATGIEKMEFSRRSVPSNFWRQEQGCQIFLGPSIPNNYLQTQPHGYKVYKIAVKYSKWS